MSLRLLTYIAMALAAALIAGAFLLFGWAQ